MVQKQDSEKVSSIHTANQKLDILDIIWNLNVQQMDALLPQNYII